MTRKAGKYLVRHYNTWCVEMTIPADIRHHFPHDGGKANLRGKFKRKLARSLGTSDFSTAEVEKLKHIYEWKKLFQFYRDGGIDQLDVDHMTVNFEQQLAAHEDQEIARAVVSDQNFRRSGELSPAQVEARRTAFARSTGQLCSLMAHVDDFVDGYGYRPAVADDARNFIKNRFAKRFEYFEWIEEQQIKEYITVRMDGADGDNPWARRTAQKYLSYAKQYWSWCRDRGLTDAHNLIVFENVLPKANKTKAHRNAGKDANLPYSIADCWKLYDAAVEAEEQRLADMIILGMFTGCRIGELAHMQLKDVGSDRLTVEDSKTDSGLRDIPIHRDIQQIVERLKQTSEDGYLISGLSDNNKHRNRGKGIGQKFMRHKAKLGFAKKESSFHSFRSTLATRFQSAGVEELFAARIIGHAAGNTMSYGLYAGDIDWDKAEAAMAKISYPRAI